MNRSRRAVLALLPALLALPRAAAAHSYSAGEVAVGHPWARPTGPDERVGFAWMPLVNRAATADRLLGAATPVAGRVRLREPGQGFVTHFELPAKQPLAMRPGARELVLEDLRKPLRLDDRFPLELRFQRAGTLTVEVWVETSPYGK